MSTQFQNDSRLALTLPWDEIESGAQDQIEKVLQLPFLKKLAIMPDVHMGYDLPIGGVALLEGKICPSFVGYDIGCGMCHVKLGSEFRGKMFEDFDIRNGILYELSRHIPVGSDMHQKPQYMYDLGNFESASGDKELTTLVQNKLHLQAGTLGGGNHFLEIGVNPETDDVGITIHSGSRRPGWDIGNWYMKKEKFLDIDSELGRAYIADMQWAQDYAVDNRRKMIDLVLQLFGITPTARYLYCEESVNENHNHATINPDGTVLHRKGATPAEKGKFGIIPANQRDGVYITVGLGNEDFLSSASHGAGRKMSRGQALRTIDAEKFKNEMLAAKIANCITDKNIDEAPDAYKDIDTVLKYQNGILVNVVERFIPILVLKG